MNTELHTFFTTPFYFLHCAPNIMISPSVIFLLFSEPQSGTTTVYYPKYFVYLFILERQLTVRELDCVWWYGIWTYNPEARHFMFNLIKGA